MSIDEPKPDAGEAASAALPEDEAPDYVRMGILAAILVALVGVLIYTRFINPPKPEFFATLPGIDLAGVTDVQRAQILELANATKCPCSYAGGCKLQVAECRHKDPTCDVSLKLAGEIVQSVTGRPAKVTVKLDPAPSVPAKKAPHDHGK